MSGAVPARTGAGSRLALIVANGVYDDEGLAALVSPATDAVDLARSLAAPGTCGFTVDTVLDASSSEVTGAVEDFLADRDRADLLLLYFSCHGLKDEQGRLYFAARNTRRNRLRSTAIPAGLVNDLLLACRSRRKVLILDCCYSGAFAKGMQVKADPQMHTVDHFDARGLVVLTASDSAQYAFEGDTVRGSAAPSAFTAALVGGLDTGDADVDHDGLISVDDAHEYIRGRLAEQPHPQNPRKWEFDVQGRIVIARTARPEPTAAPTAAPPAVLPPRQSPTTPQQPVPPPLRQPAWWAALALLLISTLTTSGLLSWWPIDLAYQTIASQYLPPPWGLVAATASAVAAWAFAYAVADAVARTRQPTSTRWPELQLRWLRILAELAVPSSPRHFFRAVSTAVPLNVLIALTVATTVSAFYYNPSGADARNRVFILVFVTLTVLPLGWYLRRTTSTRTDTQPPATNR